MVQSHSTPINTLSLVFNNPTGLSHSSLKAASAWSIVNVKPDLVLKSTALTLKLATDVGTYPDVRCYVLRSGRANSEELHAPR